MERKKGRGGVSLADWIPLGILMVSFGVGGALGLFFAASVDGAGGEALADYLTAYLELAAQDGLPVHSLPILWEQMKLPICALVLGCSPLGVVGLPVLVGARGFFLTYSVGCFVRIFGEQGLLAAGFLFGITACITVPALFVLCVQGLRGSAVLLRGRLGDRYAGAAYVREDWVRAGLCFGAVLVAVLVEGLVVPALLRSVATMLVG